MSDITTSKTLNMTFGNTDGNRKISLAEPLDDLAADTVSLTMGEIVALETLVDGNGNLLTDVMGAEIQTVTTQTLFSRLVKFSSRCVVCKFVRLAYHMYASLANLHTALRHKNFPASFDITLFYVN